MESGSLEVVRHEVLTRRPAVDPRPPMPSPLQHLRSFVHLTRSQGVREAVVHGIRYLARRSGLPGPEDLGALRAEIVAAREQRAVAERALAESRGALASLASELANEAARSANQDASLACLARLVRTSERSRA